MGHTLSRFSTKIRSYSNMEFLSSVPLRPPFLPFPCPFLFRSLPFPLPALALLFLGLPLVCFLFSFSLSSSLSFLSSSFKSFSIVSLSLLLLSFLLSRFALHFLFKFSDFPPFSLLSPTLFFSFLSCSLFSCSFPPTFLGSSFSLFLLFRLFTSSPPLPILYSFFFHFVFSSLSLSPKLFLPPLSLPSFSLPLFPFPNSSLLLSLFFPLPSSSFSIVPLLSIPVVLLLLVLVGKELLGFGGPPDASLPKGAGGVEADKEAFEMQASAGAGGKGGATVVPKDPEDRPAVTKDQVVVVTGLTATMLFLYDGLQAGYGGYVFSYAVKSIAGMSMNEAAYLNACFWGTFAFGRLVSIGIATRLAPSFMLLCNIVVITNPFFVILFFHIPPILSPTLSLPCHLHLLPILSNYTFSLPFSSLSSPSPSYSFPRLKSNDDTNILLQEFDAWGPASVLVSGVIVTLISFVVYFLLYLVAQTITRQTSDRSLVQRLKSLLTRRTEETAEDTGLMKHHVKYYTRMRSDLSESSLGDEGQTDVGDVLAGTKDNTPMASRPRDPPANERAARPSGREVQRPGQSRSGIPA
ncbi:Major facilitator superfamily domain-containing protein 4 [Penaeus vannamei]|uniref:Major facilitator superfamily domain-containing protein 4 n=1 Tax=Penaeus vannamei TaxID=6689 RepID=A0A423STW1_PENVA|nr:Major facilitator superfamily domain-containing protein 4 [Penaeus vannamei]